MRLLGSERQGDGRLVALQFRCVRRQNSYVIAARMRDPRTKPVGTVAARSRHGMPFRQQVLVATPNADEAGALSAWLDAEAFEPLSKPTSRSASDAVASQPFDLAVVDAGFVLDGSVRAFG